MSRLTLVTRIANTLRSRPGQRFNYSELARLLMSEYPQWVIEKRNKSRNPVIRDGGEEEMHSQICSEIGSNKAGIEKHPNLRITEDTPRRYYFTELSEEQEVEAVDAGDTGPETRSLTEKDLYPLLSEYLLSGQGVMSKRVNESRTRGRAGPGANHWLHPDLIGFEVLSSTWSDTVQQLATARGDAVTRLWSFEVKKLINRANVREVYFQALSNSAWANYGYLVAMEITGSGTLDELSVLAAQHGIGVIRINAEAVSDSTILIPAAFKPEVDWAAADRLAAINADADDIFQQMRVYHQAGVVNNAFWDAKASFPD